MLCLIDVMCRHIPNLPLKGGRYSLVSSEKRKFDCYIQIWQIPSFIFHKLLLIFNATYGSHCSKNNIVVGYQCNGYK